MESLTAKQAHEIALEANKEYYQVVINKIKSEAEQGKTSLIIEDVPKAIINELDNNGFEIQTFETIQNLVVTISW